MPESSKHFPKRLPHQSFDEPPQAFSSSEEKAPKKEFFRSTPPPHQSAKFGRRAGRHHEGNQSDNDVLAADHDGKNISWQDNHETESPVAKGACAQDVPMMADGEDDPSYPKERGKLQEQPETFEEKILEMPTNYQAPLPSLKDLDIHCNWDRLLQTIHSEFDMSCLTTCLSRELDEDIPWNPEMLLVQLSSDMRDAAEIKKGEDGLFVPVEAQEIGLMAGGEVIRRRRAEDNAQNQDSEPVPCIGKGEKSKNAEEGLLFSNPKRGSEVQSTKGSETNEKDRSKTSLSEKLTEKFKKYSRKHTLTKS